MSDNLAITLIPLFVIIGIAIIIIVILKFFIVPGIRSNNYVETTGGRKYRKNKK